MTSSKERNEVIQGGEKDRTLRAAQLYEPPCVIPLGELARGYAACGTGPFPGDECLPGTIGFNMCNTGWAALSCVGGNNVLNP